MIVVDSSVILEVLLRTKSSQTIEKKIFSRGQTLHAPHLIDIEIAQVIRRYASAGEITPERGSQAIEDLIDFRISRYSHDILLPRIWELRTNMTAYDATYVSLAEILDSPLLTRDAKLARSPGSNAKIRLI
ncbi:type II toxin-antitoxin system VapC family toxin [bacterium]|nr:type II toxin-antitoxin system VapC family toxin [bacterium]MCI0615961.1 type II toxin-antitoxin system VapC family toxin [bacterium]